MGGLNGVPLPLQVPLPATHGAWPGTPRPAASSPSTAGQHITVAVLDPQPTYAYGLSALLTSVTVDIRVTGVATSTETGREMLAARCPQVVMLGVAAAGNNEAAMLRTIRLSCPESRVLVLAADDLSVDAAVWLRLGVHGYLGKDAGVEQLVSAVRVISTGGVVVARSALEHALDAHAEPGHTLDSEEQRLLRLVLEGLTNVEIAARLAVSTSTLKRMVHRLVKRLRARDRMHAALLAQQRGLL